MFNKAILLGTAALAALAFAGPALAVSGSSPVNVSVTIAPTVSMWGADAALNLDGSNSPDNSDAVLSSISYINNVDANISASVAGIPVGTLPGGGIQFHIFDGNDPGAALIAINAGPYLPSGAITFNHDTQATPQTLIATTGVNTSIHDEPIVYAAGLPGDLPAPTTANLVVTYTITSN